MWRARTPLTTLPDSASNTVMLQEILLVPAGYLAGSVASAIIVCRLMGLPDPRSGGSGNPGATNVLRLGGKKAAALTLLGDVLKGLLPVLAGHALGVSVTVLAATAVAAFLGHLYPVFFGFRGGKGVATGFGALTALAWPAAAGALLVWMAMAAVFRYSSLAALTAAAAAPLFVALWRPHPAMVAAAAVISLLLVWRHRENIQRLLSGTEGKLGARSRDAA